MSQFSTYFGYGYTHIVDYGHSYDHILFIVALCAVYLLRDWKRVLILVTAFTIGHSVTLALASLAIIHVNSSLIEFLIPLTIFITALSNLLRKEESLNRNVQLNYVYALFFGFIHGMAFAEAFGMGSKHIAIRLLAFNLGLELGQIIIVVLFLSMSFISVDIFGLQRRIWKIAISSLIAIAALFILKDRIYW